MNDYHKNMMSQDHHMTPHQHPESSIILGLKMTIYEEAESKAPKPAVEKKATKVAVSEGDTLVYMKIKVNRELDEVVKIIESLKD